MTAISPYLPHIGFYLAFFFTFTYYFAARNAYNDGSNLDNKKNPTWHGILILCVLVLSTYVIVLYPLIAGITGLVPFNNFSILDAVKVIFTPLMIHVVIYTLIFMVGYSLMKKLIFGA